MFLKQTIRDIDLKGKKVLLRADYNVPIEHGQIADDYRLKQSLPTINYLLERDVKLIICSHLGRPKGKVDPALSLKPVAVSLSQLLSRPVNFVPDCIGDEVKKAVKKLEKGQILLLENLRFHQEEEANDKDFAKDLAKLADVFVQDGFGVVHRAHASTEGVTHYLPSVAGLLLEKEVDTITKIMDHPSRPLMAIIGGAKIADKLLVLKRFVELADVIAIGGAMANTFLVAEGHHLGASLYDATEIDLAKEIMAAVQEQAKNRHCLLLLPRDGVVTNKVDSLTHTRIVEFDSHVYSDIEFYPKATPTRAGQVEDGEMVVDIGPLSSHFISGAVQLCQTVVWSGPLGITETASLQGPTGPFAHGTETVIEALVGDYGHKPFTLVGGGDTVGYVEARGLVEFFNHVSTGGSASLDLMGGQPLPGVEALLDKGTRRR